MCLNKKIKKAAECGTKFALAEAGVRRIRSGMFLERFRLRSELVVLTNSLVAGLDEKSCHKLWEQKCNETAVINHSEEAQLYSLKEEGKRFLSFISKEIKGKFVNLEKCSKEICFEGKKFEISPDFVWGNEKGEIIIANVELGRAMAYAETDIHNFLMEEWGKENGYSNIEARIYFLASNKDKETELETAFSGTTQVRKNKGTGKEALRKLINEGAFDNITECSNKNCTMCSYNEVCNPGIKSTLLKEKKEDATKVYTSPKLNEEQNALLLANDRLIVVDAGAGSGKTCTLTEYIINKVISGVDGEKILVVTFTNAGVKEIQERVGLALESYGIEENSITFLTYDRLGELLIKKYHKELGYTKVPKLASISEEGKIIKDVYEKHPLIKGLRNKHPEMALDKAKGAYIELKEIFEKRKLYGESAIESSDMEELYQEYSQALKTQNLVTYADHMAQSDTILLEHPEALAQLGYEIIIVDEAQDTNPANCGMLAGLLGADAKQMVLVGDTDQAIYGFRGSTPELLQNTERYLGKAKRTTFTKNYRSTRQIVLLGNKILNSNPGARKFLYSGIEGEEPSFDWAEDAATSIVQRIKETKEEERNFTVICRNKTDINEVQKLLSKEGIPTNILSGEDVLCSLEAKGVMGLTRFLASVEEGTGFKDYDTVGLCQYLKLIGKEIPTKIDEAKDFIFVESMNLIDEVKEKIDFIKAFVSKEAEVNAAMEYIAKKIKPYKTLKELKEFFEVTLMFNDTWKVEPMPAKRGINLATAHATKGMEFENVILNLDHFDAKCETAEDYEEARRLTFVAVTRAKRNLSIYATRKKNRIAEEIDRYLK